MVERLTKDLPLDGGEPFLVYFGNFVNDIFCGPEYTCNSIGIALWRFFRRQDYQRIVFYEGANRLCWYDDQSRMLCRFKSPPSKAPLSQSGLSSPRMVGGPMGKRNLVEEQRNQKQPVFSSGQTEAKQSATAAVSSEQPRRAISDVAALEILNYILTLDSTPVATALVFTHANDLDRRNLGGETTFRELQNRMVQWAQKVTRRPNLCVFIFQDTSRDTLLETCHRQELTVLSNFLKRQEGRTTYVRDVNAPSDSEILRLIHRYRLTRNLQVNWSLLPHIAGLLARQNLTIKRLRAKLENTANLNRETLLEWSCQQFIQAKEHIIQHLGARMQDVNTNDLRQKLSPVVGQQDNIELVIRAVSSWLGAPSQLKPLTLFMAGTSGVGKTYTVQLLAEALQPYGFDFCDFQMTEFSEEHRVSSLIGSPPGYLGSEDEPRIFQALRQSSRLVILFDEIEKAHKRVITALMQLIDEGKLSWSGGQGDFRECILCFTSNAQRQEMVDIKQSTQKVGLSLEGPDFQNQVRDILVRAHIVPEVCGRINRFLIYNPLNLDSTVRITSQQVHRLAAEYKVDVQSIHPEFLAKSAIASAGSIYGARPIRDHVREMLSNSLTLLLSEYPRTRRIQIEKNDTTGSYSVCAAVAEEPTCQTDESGTAIRLCQGLQRQERMLDKDAMKQMLSQVYCQQDEIDLMIREVVTWFGQVEKQRPLSLFLAGTSGVGKTFTCELLAKAMESQKFACVYFPMSEYSQESHITNLIGSSSGYEGSQETPKIFAALERSKRLVIVFDEIEKAHPTILRTLMQLFEKGVLSWSKGEGDFRQCIICFTSNAQRKELVDLKSSYRCSGRDTGDTFFQNTVRDVLTRANIAPEICGRINRFFVYNPLTPDAVFHIAMAEIQKIARSYELEMVSGDPELLAEIALSTTGSPYGARPITRRIENILGHELLQFNNLFPDVTHVAYQKSISGYEIVAINPDNGYPDMDALMHKAQTTYEDLTHARSFLNTEALYHTLSQVQCQEDNIQQLVERLEIWYSQKKKDRPLSIFLMGASGVGKTYTAELLAQVLQPYGYEYTYLAMTEYSQDSSANNLTGSARGFVGSEDKPRLFEALDRSNTSRLVILFDEIEKAHPTVFKTLMQLLDKGTLSWNRGTGDFRECIVLFTSNLQMDAMVGLKSVFQKSGLSILGTEFQEAIKQILFQTGLPRELCGRINQFLVYNPLSPEAAVQIVFQEIQKFCAKQGCQVDWISPLLLAETARLTAGSSSGARAVRDQVETLLSQPMLRFRKQFARAKVLLIDMTEAGIRILPADDVIDSSSQADMFRQALVLLSESQKHKISLDSNQ